MTSRGPHQTRLDRAAPTSQPVRLVPSSRCGRSSASAARLRAASPAVTNKRALLDGFRRRGHPRPFHRRPEGSRQRTPSPRGHQPISGLRPAPDRFVDGRTGYGAYRYRGAVRLDPADFQAWERLSVPTACLQRAGVGAGFHAEADRRRSPSTPAERRFRGAPSRKKNASRCPGAPRQADHPRPVPTSEPTETRWVMSRQPRT